MSIENRTIQAHQPLPAMPAGKGVYISNSALPKEGTIIQGMVTDVHGNELSILLNNGDTFSGRLPNALMYNIGQQAQFQITGTANQLIFMKPLKESPVVMEDATLSKALDEAGLPKSERNMTIVKSLLDNQLSISKQSIQSSIRLCAKFPTIDPATVITANKLNLPMTPETLTQFEHYQNNSHQLLYKADMVFEQLTEAVADQNEPVMRTFLDMLAKEIPNPDTPAAQSLPTPEIARNINTIQQVIEQSDLPEQIKQLPVKEILTSLPTATVQTLFSSPKMSELLRDVFIQNFTITPNMLHQKENVDELYKKMDETLTRLSTLPKAVENEAAVNKAKETVSDMQNNLSFMKTLNETFTYLQLPIQLKDKNIHSDLYVMTKKKSAKKDPDAPIKVLLHLDMDNLGSLDIHITKEKTNISTTFYVSDDLSGKLLGKNMELLKDAINDQGLTFTSDLVIKQKEVDLVKDFMEQNTPVGSIKRYNFDLRA